ncbi:N-acetylglutaminylglutamine amidotransferase [Afifella marina]|uniref:asparagine synthase (glutamine-hydrolyzing) n=1 Tax=Afifella marina DSM 2698 TaxID=1120955 RepID=A0A1G5P787_AFIMA|nr:N-acetylglutaminylglutamine amidotransferase [Afifella marina]MBK1625167.1 N-acetylglutaminylglutamine amidotransferase [Afifella marina DSM 2698]MBK1627071.1 N-acetylglutaminylglutamine amidotransferase [Afifella marina]MBK5919408.1 asparagine synthase (glutamine-hydrolyzing) [Afifella marina]RAI19627.1 N-acetylglutaminylglutamine amidotransferase [Afifella marina DSM 2698]SCZ44870.1 asparagine synthase (glutamine-hydrolysing) [Afifella marina DSM 2698]
MCGICGEVSFTGSQADPSAIGRMLDVLSARGPDSSGAVIRGRVGLGHRRLQIIDLSARSEQPLVDSDLGLSIVFNGCIYNYQELRTELQGKGYRFFSSGDTEVILKSWHAWGEDCVNRFHGMFAFAIHERESGRVVLARDRFGIKPLYLSETDGTLRFASSLPALVKAGGVDTTIDPVALQFYMSFHAVVPAPYTILKGVRKLAPATIRVIEADGTSREKVYWDPRYERSSEEVTRSFGEWQEMVLDALRTAVDRRMVADVPVGVLLSGGVDSSLIVGLLAEAGQKDLMTFSIGFEEAHGEKGDEFVYSDIIAKRFNTDHHKLFVPSSDLLKELPGAISAMSEPMVSYDNIGFYLLSREVAKHIKVVQSGQGADEIFGGYHWYPPLAHSNNPAADYAKVFFDRDHDRLGQHLSPDWMAAKDEARAFVEAHFNKAGAEDPVDKALRLDSTIMLVDDPVKRVDNMTMAWGLEARVPFLDHELAELAARIPPEHKLADGGKGILKAVAREVVPKEVVDREKGYFPVPALKYIAGDTLDMVRDTLTSQSARERGLFKEDYLNALFDDPSAHITPLRGSELWQVGLLELWLQNHEL